MVFGLGEKGLVIDDSTSSVNVAQATDSDGAILATPDDAPLTGSLPVQITTQTYSVLPNVWFGTDRAPAVLGSSGQVTAVAPAASAVGPINIKLFPPDGYTHVMPQAFTYGTIITSVRNSLCASAGGCSLDIFGFGLFDSDPSQTTVTIGGKVASLQSVHYFNADEAYPYPLQYVTVTVPPGAPGRADIVLHSSSGQATLPGGSLYAVSLQSYPSPAV